MRAARVLVVAAVALAAAAPAAARDGSSATTAPAVHRTTSVTRSTARPAYAGAAGREVRASVGSLEPPAAQAVRAGRTPSRAAPSVARVAMAGSAASQVPTSVLPARSLGRSGGPSGTVEGTVTDAAGLPVSGPIAEAVLVSGSGPTTYATVEDGRYDLEGLAPGSYRICVETGGVTVPGHPTGLQPECAGGSAGDTYDGSVVAVSAGTSTDLDFSLLTAGSVAGHVVDDLGDVVVGESVQLTSSGAHPQAVDVETDQTGAYDAVGLAPVAWQLCFLGQVPGPSHLVGGTVQQCTQVTPTVGTATDGSADLQRGAALHGVVTDQNGAPFANRWFQFGEVGELRTDADGRYTVEGLPPTATSFCFGSSAAVQDVLGNCWPGAAGAYQEALDEGTDTELDPVVARTAPVHITVTDEDGHPLSEAYVSVVPRAGPSPQGYTASDGTTLGRLLIDGDATVCASESAQSAGGDSTSGYESRCTSTTLVGGTTTDVTLALPPSGAVAGTVTDPAGNGLRPTVTLFDSQDRPLSSAETTSPDGDYVTWGVESGSYTVCFALSGYEPQCYGASGPYPSGAPVEVTAGRTTSGIDVVLQPGS